MARLLDLREDVTRVKGKGFKTTYAVVTWAYWPSELQGDAAKTFRAQGSIPNELILSDHGEQHPPHPTDDLYANTKSGRDQCCVHLGSRPG